MSCAEVAELADALRSGRSGQRPIGVQIPASAPLLAYIPGRFRDAGISCPVMRMADMARSIRRTFRIPHPTRQRLLKFVFLAFLLWFLGHYVLEIWEYMGVRAEEARWQEAVNQEAARHTALVQRLEQVRSDPYVEKVARESFGMARPGEHVVRPFLYDRSDGIADADKGADARPTWQQWWDRFFAPDDR